MAEKVRISVIIPVYNGREHLPQCLESVQRQNVPGMEILCVDDGSTDGSADILACYAARDDRIRVIRQHNQYAGIARNHGMQRARGKYLAFLDADDFYLPGTLERSYGLAETHRLDLVKGRFTCLDTRTARRFMTEYSRNDGVPKNRVLSFRQTPDRLLHAADVPWNGLYRRAFLEAHEIAFNHLRCINDHSFYIQCLLHAERLLFSRDAVTCYRVNQAGSLIGQKATYFDAQLENYRIVRGLCRNAEPVIAEKILRCELTGILDWYTRLLPFAAEPVRLQEQLRRFLQDFDETDVGAKYLQSFPFREAYYALRCGGAPPGKRPAWPVRLARCWQEHGCRYIWERALARHQEKKYEMDPNH